MRTMIRQVKLVSGEELVCEVLHDSVDEQSDEIIIRHALKIVSKIHNGYKYYTFKPFMVFSDTKDSLTMLRDGAIISYTIPHDTLIAEYREALSQINDEVEEDLSMPKFSGDSDSNVVAFKKPTHH
jgi:hypothetical protein